MIYLGIDPDTSATGMAWASIKRDGARLLAVASIKSPKGSDPVLGMLDALRHVPPAHIPDICIVEGQQLYLGGANKASPSSLLKVAQVAGGAALQFHADRIPLPAEWKGSVPKHIHQSRDYAKLGIRCSVVGSPPKPGKKDTRYAVPDPKEVEAHGCRFLTKVNKADWKHIGDAIGLALWGRSQEIKTAAFARRLESLDGPAR